MGNRVVGALRRLPQKVDARRLLTPKAPIELDVVDRVDLAADGDWWLPSGPDPHVVFAPPEWGGFPSGRTELSFELSLPLPLPVQVELHVNTGQGWSEETKVVLPVTHGGRVEVVVDLPDDLVGLRIDVPDDVGPFNLGEVALRRGVDGRPWSGPHDAWARWVEDHALAEADRQAIRELASAHADGPAFSIVLPVHDPSVDLLRQTIDSVRGQLWPHWQLCICDDASRDPEVRNLLDEAAASDDRIVLVRRLDNGNISAASNDALALAEHAWVAFLDHDDLLAEQALASMARAILDRPDVDLLFSDEDKVDIDGRRHGPYFKPDLDLALLHGQNVVNHLMVVRRDVVDRLGGLRSEVDGAQDHDLVFRIVEAGSLDRVTHVPEVLYHWRVVKGSVAQAPDQKGWAHDAAERVLAEHLVRTDLPFEVGRVDGTPYRRVLPTSAQEIEVVAVVDPAGANATVRASEADVVILLGQGVQPDGEGDVRALAARLEQPGAVAAGPRVVRHDGRWDSAGMVVASDGAPRPVLHGHRLDDLGPFGRGVLAQRVTSVGGGVVALLRDAFLAAGGLDEALPFDDVGVADLCLRLADRGGVTLFVPESTFRRDRPSASGDGTVLRQRWSDVLERDRWWNPNLAIDPPDGRLRS